MGIDAAFSKLAAFAFGFDPLPTDLVLFGAFWLVATIVLIAFPFGVSIELIGQEVAFANEWESFDLSESVRWITMSSDRWHHSSSQLRDVRDPLSHCG